MTTVGEIISRIEEFAPKYLAEDWDPIGLAFGDKDQVVNKMMVALDLDADTLAEAKEKEIDFIFTHHPSIFNSLTTLNAHDSRRRQYLELIRSNIALYSAHTNVDAAENGMNDWLAKALGLKKPYEVLDTAYESELKLLVLYTPIKEAAEMRTILHKVGAGQVGDYDEVSYTSAGEGHFTPNPEAKPTVGEENTPEVVQEERVEMLVPKQLLGQILEVIYENHPYEEPVYHILDIGKKDKTYGIGRVGSLESPQSFTALLKQVKETFNLSHVRHANTALAAKIEKVAILGGSGEKYYKQALAKDADVYITGDITYHGAQDMIREGLPFIDAGHFIENIFVEKMTEKLQKWQQEEDWAVEIIPAEAQEDVFKFY
jgi:dinuclear metal center YbgI/SA1388 family protein